MSEFVFISFRELYSLPADWACWVFCQPPVDAVSVEDVVARCDFNVLVSFCEWFFVRLCDLYYFWVFQAGEINGVKADAALNSFFCLLLTEHQKAFLALLVLLNEVTSFII